MLKRNHYEFFLHESVCINKTVILNSKSYIDHKNLVGDFKIADVLNMKETK